MNDYEAIALYIFNTKQDGKHLRKTCLILELLNKQMENIWQTCGRLLVNTCQIIYQSIVLMVFFLGERKKGPFPTSFYKHEMEEMNVGQRLKNMSFLAGVCVYFYLFKGIFLLASLSLVVMLLMKLLIWRRRQKRSWKRGWPDWEPVSLWTSGREGKQWLPLVLKQVSFRDQTAQ